MSGARRVLCVSSGDDFAAAVSAPLEYSHTAIEVLTVDDPVEAADVIESEPVDAVVTDFRTVADAPGLLEAVREPGAELPLLLASPYDAADGSSVAIAEVVDFLEDAASDDAEAALSSWVAGTVVGSAGGPRRTDGLDRLVRAVKVGLVDATGPTDVEAAVCDRVVARDEYAFAWIGEYDRGEGQVVPWATAARGDPWPRSETFPVDDGDGVVARVVREREPSFVDDLSAHLDPVPWRDVAAERGATGAAFLPLQASDDVVGVLGVYTTDPAGFSDAETDALRAVGDGTARILEGMAVRGRIDQQERTLRRYRRLVETVGDGMYALDEEGHFMTVNEALCAMTGYAREGLLGEHVGLVLDDAGLADWEAAVDALADGDAESTSIELEVHRKDGSTVLCENVVATTPSRGEDGFGGTVGVLRDVTERKQRERELRRQNERLDAFASIVSHDLRNPLNVAQGYVELLAEGDADPETVGNVTEALDRMNELIEDVLALAREGKTVTETQPVALGELATDAWANVDTAGADLTVEEPPTVRADPTRLQRVLENLFRNAVQHGMPDGGPEAGDPPVRVEDPPAESSGGPGTDSEARDGGASLSIVVGALDAAGPGAFYVEDDGPGIPRDIRERIFESEFTTAADGHGIGLWVVREVADAHGWDVAATAGRAGGARFEFTGVDPA